MPEPGTLPGGRVEIVDVDVHAWVEKASANPDRYRDRQVTEIVLAAIGVAPNLKTALVLKGGTAMALAFRSDRVTADVDFSTDAEPEAFADMIVNKLNTRMPRAAIRLGYLDLLCRVQSVRKMPRPANFGDHDFPALLVRIGSARRGSPEEPRLAAGQASRVLAIEISFRDQVYAFQEGAVTRITAIDSTYVKAQRAAAGGKRGLTRRRSAARAADGRPRSARSRTLSAAPSR